MAKQTTAEAVKGLTSLLAIGAVAYWYFIGDPTKPERSVGISAAVASQPTLAVPPAEQQFIATINRFISLYKAAPNEMAQGAERVARAGALREALGQTTEIQDWIGTVKELSSTNSGKGVLVLSLDSAVSVGTTNNELSNVISSATLIEPSDPLYHSAIALAVGQPVKFSGRFIQAAEDYLSETSLTMEGSMTEPEFEMRFTAIAPAR
jgi:hypothetical protein